MLTETVGPEEGPSLCGLRRMEVFTGEGMRYHPRTHAKNPGRGSKYPPRQKPVPMRTNQVICIAKLGEVTLPRDWKNTQLV